MSVGPEQKVFPDIIKINRRLLTGPPVTAERLPQQARLCYDFSMAIPTAAQRFFWDVNLSSLDMRRHAYFIIERLLEYGDVESVRWMLRIYSRRRITRVLKTTRMLTPKAANFWAMYFEIPKRQIPCLNISFLKKQKNFWPY